MQESSTITARKPGGKPVILVFPFNQLSHYLRCLMLARKFRPHFEVLFCYSEQYAAFVEKEQVRMFSCATLNSAKVMEAVRKFDFSWLNEEALETVYKDQVRSIELLRPVAVLGDTSPTLKMAAEKTGVTYISLMNGYMSKYYSRVRTISITHPAYRYLQLLPASLQNVATQKGEMVSFFTVHGAFKKIRKKQRLKRKLYYLDELEGDINLVCDLENLFPLKKLPANYKQIAPLFYNTPSRVGGLTKKGDRNKKTVFVSMGSTGDWQTVAFLNHAEFGKYNIVTAGDTGNVLHGRHITRLAFVNIHDIFPYTDLVICHGGNGTVYQALYYGIPMLCKTSHFEQEWNVEALEKVGAGRSINGLSSDSEYFEVIEEWINRKPEGNPGFYRHRIMEQAARLQSDIDEVASRILGGVKALARN